jgi:hypothetical protein
MAVGGRGVSSPPLERYVKQPELARLMDVSVRTIKRWTAEGMPSETWGMRARRYLPSRAMAWASARGRIASANQPGQRANATGPNQRR